ncbi:hypothetical protein ACJJTC_012437 [Scirpophaga incertulas]
MVQEHWGIKFKPKQGLRIARRVLGLERRGFRRRALYTLLNRASGLELRNSTLDFFRQTNPLGGYPGSRPLPRRKPRLSATGTSGVVAVLDTDLTGSRLSALYQARGLKTKLASKNFRGPKPAPPCRGGREHPEKSKHRYSTVPGCGENPSQTSGLTAGGHLGEISSGHISGPRDPRECSERQGKTGTGSPPEAPPAASDRLQRATDLYRNGMKCLNDSRNIKTEIKDQTKEAIKGLFNIVKSAEVEREKRQAEQKMKENSEEEIGRDETGSIKMCGQECKEKRVQMIEERDKYKRRCAELEIGMKEWQQEEREGKGCGRECENKRMKYGRECEKRIEKEWQKKDETNENRIRKLRMK